MSIQLNQRRATLFIAGQLNFTEEVLPQYISEFSSLGLLPSVNKGFGIKITPKGIEPETVVSLDLKRLNDTLKVSFGPDRVDIVSTKSDETWISFCDIIKEISNVLINKMQLKYSRLALCANVVYSIGTLGNSAYEKLTKTNDEHPVEWQIRKVIRNEIKDTSIQINNVYTLSHNDIGIDGTDSSDKLILDFDLNTLVGTSIDKLMSIQDSFWSDMSSRIKERIGYYESIFKEWK